MSMVLMRLMPFYLAQEGSEAAASIINQVLEQNQALNASWDGIWEGLIGDGSAGSLWGTIVQVAATIAVFCLIYMFIRYGNEISKTQYIGSILEMFLFPLAVILLLGGNGTVLAQMIFLMRSIGETLTRQVLLLQVANIQLDVAVTQLQLNNLGAERVRQLYNDCQGLVGEPLNQCVESKAAEAEAIASALGAEVDTSALEAFVQNLANLTVIGAINDLSNFIEGGFVQVIQGRLFPFIQTLLYGIQWAFVQMIEVALLLTAIAAPLAVALSLLPLAGRPIWAWGSGFLSLMGLKLSYVILVGILAAVIVNTDAPDMQLTTNFGFLLFTSIFAPFIAVGLAAGGGLALFNGISRRAGMIANTITGGILSFVKLAKG